MLAKLFLVTTAIDSFWKKDQKILFLGQWCLPHNKRNNILLLDYEILEHPWSKRTKYRKAFRYCQEVYEEFLIILTAFLNEYHNTNKSINYWRIIIGPWLNNYVQVFYERFVCVKAAFENYKFDTILLSESDYYIPVTYFDMMHQIQSDAYNLQLYSQIISEFNSDYPKQRLPEFLSMGTIRRRDKADTVLKQFRKLLLRDNLILGISRRTPALVSHLGIDMLKLMIKMRGKLGFFEMELPPSIFKESPNAGVRSQLKNFNLDANHDLFKNILLKSLSTNLPIIYLEGYHALIEKLKPDLYSNKALATETGLHTNEPFKFLVAELKERGSKLLAFQHGGDYGIALHHGPEIHERCISDRFFSWGWTDRNDSKVSALPSKKLFHSYNTKKSNKFKTNFLYISTSSPRYLYRIISHADGPWFVNYMEWRIRFFGAIPSDIRQKFLVRMYMNDYGWHEREILKEKFKNICFDDRNISLVKALSSADLVVIDNRKTSYLEVLTSGKPVLLFWDPTLWELRSDARHAFNLLYEAGILYDSPDKAAQHLIRIAEDPQSWWNLSHVSQRREEFLSFFVKTRSNWVNDWASAFNSELV